MANKEIKVFTPNQRNKIQMLEFSMWIVNSRLQKTHKKSMYYQELIDTYDEMRQQYKELTGFDIKYSQTRP